MSRFRITPFGGRNAASATDQKPDRFQLNRAKGKELELEWEWGQESNELYQLHSNASASSDQPVIPAKSRQSDHLQSPFARPSTSSASTPSHSAAEHPFARRRFSKQPDTGLSSQPDTGQEGVVQSDEAQRSALDPTLQQWQRPALEGEIVTADDQVVTDDEYWDRTVTESPSLWQRPTSLEEQSVSRDEILSSNGTSDGPSPTQVGREPTTLSDSESPRLGARPRKSVAARSQLASLFTGEDGLRRVLTTRMALDDALDRWWTHSEVAPLALLRDALLVLEAGHDLDETQRSFLLRTALRTGRGMVTALYYQLDADRTAFLIKEALLDTKHTFDPRMINYLRVEDEQSDEWADYLEHDLAYEATVASGKRSQLAATALAAMRQPLTQVVQSGHTPPQRQSQLRPPLASIGERYRRHFALKQQDSRLITQMVPLSHRWSLRWLVWACLMLLLLLSFSWPQLQTTAAMVAIPSGTYLVSDPTSSGQVAPLRFQTITMRAYRIDQHEVTNAAYRRCWEQNVCPIPSSFDSATRPGYFVNRSYHDFPVVNIQWEAAHSYCTWVGKRLPTVEEWEIAASFAPATGRRFIFPWGDRFDQRLVNGGVDGAVDTQIQDTQASGTYHPAGSTVTGLMDMAGNVAEWTSTPANSMLDGYMVKGGSFSSTAEELRNSAFLEIQQDAVASWLGFRCADEE